MFQAAGSLVDNAADFVVIEDEYGGLLGYKGRWGWVMPSEPVMDRILSDQLLSGFQVQYAANQLGVWAERRVLGSQTLGVGIQVNIQPFILTGERFTLTNFTVS